MNSEEELDIRQYIHLLRKRAWLLVTIAALFVIAAGMYSFVQPKIYEATAKVVLSQQQDSLTSTGLLSDPNSFQSQVGTQVQVVKSPDVAKVANTELGAKTTQVISVSASGVTNTRILAISAQSKSPEVAQAAANAYMTAYLANRSTAVVNDLLSIGNTVQAKQKDLQNQIDDLNSQISSKPVPTNVNDLRAQVDSLNAQVNQLQSQYTSVQAQATVRQSGASQLATAEMPSSPISPKPLRNMAVAAVLGLLIGVGIALLLERLDDKVRTEEDLIRALPDVPILASIPKVTDWKDEAEAKAVTILEPQSPAAESYRRLRTGIEFAGLERQMRVIEVTSSATGEGKSTTVANLATALAWAGNRVVIVAGDLRRPRVHDFFHVSNEVGFTSVLLSGEDVASVLQPTDHIPGGGSVHVLATGPLPPNPAELLGGDRVRELLELLRKHADYVLFDSPPVLPVADPLVLSSYADGIIFVVGAEKIGSRQLERALGLISKAKAPLVGTVLNGATVSAEHYRYDQYYYSSHASQDITAAAKEAQAKQQSKAESKASTPTTDPLDVEREAALAEAEKHAEEDPKPEKRKRGRKSKSDVNA